MMSEQRFFFQGATTFHASANTRYIIKLYNSGRPKLISMQIRFITEQSHVEDLLSADDTEHFTPYITQIINQVEQAMNSFRRLWFYDFTKVKETAELAKLFYVYEIFEMLLAGAVAFLQVRMVNKLLRGNSTII